LSLFIILPLIPANDATSCRAPGVRRVRTDPNAHVDRFRPRLASPCLTSWRAGSLPLSHTHRHNLLSNWIISHQPHRPAPCSGPKIRYVIIGSFDPNSARDEMHHFATIVIAIAYFSLLRPPILAAIHAPVQIWSSTNLAFPSRSATALDSTTRLSRMTKRCRPVHHLLRALRPSNANLDFSTTNLPMRKLTFTYP